MITRVVFSLLFPLLVALAFITSAGCRPKADAPPTLVVGMELAYPPFEMTDARGRPAGVSVELAHALGAYLGRPVRIENIPFDGLITSLRTGRIDLIISSMTATEERSRSIAFSEPYLSTGLTLLVPIDSPVMGINDLNTAGKRVAVKNGTTGHAFARRHLLEASILIFDHESAAVTEVTQKKVDAFIYDQMSTYRNWRRHERTTRPLLDPFQKESWAIGIAQGRPGLVEEVNAFLRDFRDAGGFERLGDQFLAEQKKAFAELGLPFVF